MRKFYNVLGIAGMIILLPLVYVANVLSDLKSHKPPGEPIKEVKKRKILRSTYPDEWYEDATPEDFNKWANDIHRQLN